MNLELRRQTTQEAPFWEISGVQGCLGMVTCPNGHLTRIDAHQYRIGPTGMLLPAFQCPKCEFYEYITLKQHPACK